MSIREHLKAVGIIALLIVTVSVVLYVTPLLLIAIGWGISGDPEDAPQSLWQTYVMTFAPTIVLVGIWSVIIRRRRNSN